MKISDPGSILPFPMVNLLMVTKKISVDNYMIIYTKKQINWTVKYSTLNHQQ